MAKARVAPKTLKWLVYVGAFLGSFRSLLWYLLDVFGRGESAMTIINGFPFILRVLSHPATGVVVLILAAGALYWILTRPEAGATAHTVLGPRGQPMVAEVRASTPIVKGCVLAAAIGLAVAAVLTPALLRTGALGVSGQSAGRPTLERSEPQSVMLPGPRALPGSRPARAVSSTSQPQKSPVGTPEQKPAPGDQPEPSSSLPPQRRPGIGRPPLPSSQQEAAASEPLPLRKVTITSQEQVNSTKQDAPFTTKVVVTTTTTIQPVWLCLACDAEVMYAEVFLNQGTTTHILEGLHRWRSQDRRKVWLAFTGPAFLPETPLVLTLSGRERIEAECLSEERPPAEAEPFGRTALQIAM